MTAKESIRIIYYYSGGSVTEGETLKRVMERTVSPDSIAVCRSLESFARELRYPMGEFSIVVVLTAVRDELSNMLLFQDLLLDRRLILVLPDDDPETLSQGHTLRPRYVSYVDGDYSDVAVVLERMVSHCENNSSKGY